MANYLLSLPTVALLVSVACLVFHMLLKISLLALLILVTAGTFAFSGFGLTIAIVANTMQEAQIYNNLAWLGLLFLSRITVPLPLLPGWIQRLVTFLPSTCLVSACQTVMVQGHPLLRHWPELLALVISGDFGVLLAWKLFGWEKEERIPPRRKAWTLAFVFPFLLIGSWMNAFANPTAAWASAYSLIERGTGGVSDASGNDAGTILENFEGPQAAENLTREWQVVITTEAGFIAVAEVTSASPGAAGTEHMMRVQGRLASGSGASVGITASKRFPVTPRKALRGITFWLRGNAPFVRVNLRTQG